MKLKNKLILIFILFACFVIFNNSDCFAYDYGISVDDLPENLVAYDVLYSTLQSKYGTSKFIMILWRAPDTHNLYLITSPINSFSNSSNTNSTACFSYRFSYGENRVIPETLNVDDNFSPIGIGTYFIATFRHQDDGSYLIAFNTSTTDRYYGGHNYDYNYARGQVVDQSYYELAYCSTYFVDKTGNSPIVNCIPNTLNSAGIANFSANTKHDLFQLKLTDKNFNNALHTFTLNTDENFVNYSEITDLIENNNKYCIYVTDYTRLLTFSDNSFNASLESSSYLLSGYIDFLVSDNAYFYFSPHYNRIKVCGGDYHYGLVTDSIKRYFFNLVYSGDSDNTYFTISDDNGLLWCLSDFDDNNFSQTEAISDFANTYFIGSNQTIYYANEDSNYILDSLTDSIYYGKDRGADERIYNFGFSGGNKKEFYLNEATFDNNVATQNQIITEKSPVVSSEETFQPVIIHDESSGNSSVIPQDSTTYTYPANTVTDETTPEEDATHRQNERIPYTSTDTNEDTSNWSLWDFIKGIFGKIGDVLSSIGNLVSDLISGFVNLFIPTAQQWDNLKNDYSVLGYTIQSHLPFVSFISSTFEEAQNTVVSPFDFLNITMPSFSFYGGNTEQTNYVNVRDAYEPYRIQIRFWLVLIVYGVAFVYIVKHVSDYGATQYANSVLDALQSGNRLGRGKGD